MKVRKLRWRFYSKKGGPRQFGNRCSLYARGCICCDAYFIFYKTGKFPSMDEAREFTPPSLEEYPFDIPWTQVIAG